MRFRNILRYVPQQFRRIFMVLLLWGDGHLTRTVRAFQFAVFLNFCMLFVGVLIGWIGFRFVEVDIFWRIPVEIDTFWWIRTGQFFIALSGAVAAIFWAWIFLRVFVLGKVTTGASSLFSAVVREASRPLPSTPITIPILEDEKTDHFLRAMMAIFAWIASFSALAVLFPVYTSPINFLGVFIGAAVVGFTTYAFRFQVYWAPRYLLGIGLVLLVVSILGTIFPGQFLLSSMEHIYWQKELMIRADVQQRLDDNRMAETSSVLNRWTELELKRRKGALSERELTEYNATQERLERLKDEATLPDTAPGKKRTGAATFRVPISTEPPMYDYDSAISWGGLLLFAGIAAAVMGARSKNEKKG